MYFVLTFKSTITSYLPTPEPTLITLSDNDGLVVFSVMTNPLAEVLESPSSKSSPDNLADFNVTSVIADFPKTGFPPFKGAVTSFSQEENIIINENKMNLIFIFQMIIYLDMESMGPNFILERFSFLLFSPIYILEISPSKYKALYLDGEISKIYIGEKSKKENLSNMKFGPILSISK